MISKSITKALSFDSLRYFISHKSKCTAEYRCFQKYAPIFNSSLHKQYRKVISPRWLIISMAWFAISTSYAEALCEPYKKIDGLKIVEKGSNLLDYPEKRTWRLNGEKQFTLGDLHGNALKLLYFLIKENLIELTQEDYMNFSYIYHKETESVTTSDLKQFQKILDKITWLKEGEDCLVRFLGDEFCDRGQNDYYTLKLLEALQKKGMPFEILFSNHGYELISCYEKGLLSHVSYLETIECGGSLTHMREFIQKGLVSYDEIESLINKVYYPHLKLLSYKSLQRENKTFFTLYSHAPIGLKTIKALAIHKNFALSFGLIENQSLEFTIDKINSRFKEILYKKRISHEFDQEIHSATPSDKIPLSLPLKRCIWSRGYQETDLPIKQKGHTFFSYVHGHDGMGFEENQNKDHVINLDNLFGKGLGNEKGTYSSYISF